MIKKYLPTIGLYVGTFFVLNVIAHFVLRFMQPRPAPSEIVQSTTSADSLHTETADSLLSDLDVDPLSDVSSSAGVELVSADTSKNFASTTEPINPPAETVPEMPLAAQQAVVQPDPNGEERMQLDAGSVVENPEALESEVRSAAELAKLAKMLEGMKPAEAAVIAERLPTDTIVQLVMRMKARSGAKMMASLPVPVAASVAERMTELSGARKSS
ncbi:hypothetical protein KJZ99_03745 [bacterium]|nr:hypothetical protein [bacterium]